MSDTKTVKIKVTFDLEQEVPADWDDEQTMFYFNDSSSCSNNLLKAAVARYCGDYDSDAYEGCACSHTHVEMAG